VEKKPDDSQMPFREVVRRVRVHLERLRRGRAMQQAIDEAKATVEKPPTEPKMTWDEIRAEVKIHLKRAELAEAKRQAAAKPRKAARGGLFADPVALANEIARVRAELDKRRKQAAAEAGSTSPVTPFSQPAMTVSDNHAAGAVVDAAHTSVTSHPPE
jgi:hypothetical protein